MGQPQIPPDIAKCSLRGKKSPPVENHCSQQITLWLGSIQFPPPPPRPGPWEPRPSQQPALRTQHIPEAGSGHSQQLLKQQSMHYCSGRAGYQWPQHARRGCRRVCDPRALVLSPRQLGLQSLALAKEQKETSSGDREAKEVRQLGAWEI